MIRIVNVLKLIAILLCAIVVPCNAQTWDPKVESSNFKHSIVTMSDATETNTIFMINFQPFFIEHLRLGRNPWLSIGSKTVLRFKNPATGRITELPIKGLYILEGENYTKKKAYLDLKYDANTIATMKCSPFFILEFPPIPSDVSRVMIDENEGRQSSYWKGIEIQPRVQSPIPNFGNTSDLECMLNESTYPYCGHYQEVGGNNSRVILVNKNDTCLLIAEKSMESPKRKTGDLCAWGVPVSTQGYLFGQWTNEYNRGSDAWIEIGDGYLGIKFGLDKEYVAKFVLMGEPIANRTKLDVVTWTGTGFFISQDGHILTNYHVIEGAKSIEVSSFDGDMNKSYHAQVEVCDKQNDLAIIKITEDSPLLQSLPYSFKFETSDVGEECWVLGYPLTTTMGNDIKLTNGIISSKSGFEGNIAQYQISAPVQPGNSGGPVFDKSGQVIGVVQAKHMDAENVSYAIKMNYVRNLIDMLPQPLVLPTTNPLVQKSLSQQEKIASKTVVLIKCE